MGDTYRPTRRQPKRAPLSDRMTFTNGSDSYRPPGPTASRSEFTFEAQHQGPRFPPSGPAAGTDSQRQRNGAAPQRGRQRATGNNGSGPRRGTNRRGGKSFRPAAAHERALLRHRDDGGTEQTLGVAEGSSRFRNLDEMSVESEASMEMESDSTSDGKQNGNHKMARTLAVKRADGELSPQWAPSAPQWSNPDPYTALPPPSETTGVKRDVVQLIRKAKIEAAQKAAGDLAVAANDDFISFGGESGSESEDEGSVVSVHARNVRGVHSINLDGEPDGDARNAGSRNTYGGRDHGRKRKADSRVLIVPEWAAGPSRSTPWMLSPDNYAHLVTEPAKW